jgi:DNA-binding NarL/FixJ family response regulator
MKIRVFNADDHPILRKGVSDLIQETHDFEWVGSAGDGKEALEKIRIIRPDVAILDIEMPHHSGLEVAQILISENIKTQFILLTLFRDKNYFRHALDMGVKGYLLKESTEREISDCIRYVNDGKPYVTPSLTHYLFEEKEVNNILDKLSTHEINILRLISKEKTTDEIARMLFISPKTVASHRSNISGKLELSGKQNGLLKWALSNRDLLN